MVDNFQSNGEDVALHHNPFRHGVTSLDELSQAVSLYLARATEKLRAQRSTCGALHVFIMTNRFRENDRQYSNGLTIPLVTPTDDSRVLGGAALHALELIYRPGYNYKKAWRHAHGPEP